MSIRKETRAFARPNNALGAAHLAISLILYFGSVALGIWFWGNPIIVALSIVIFAGACVRLFGVQHDNGHLNYFSSRRANVWVGVLLGAFTCNPFHAMRYNHNRHHAYLGNLDHIESHEVWTMSVRDFQAAPLKTRIIYRVYRSAPVLFCLGPIFVYLIRFRWPRNAMRVGWWDAVIQNALMAVWWGVLYVLAGWTGILYIILALCCTVSVGMIMIYSGHNHEDTYWQRDGEVDFEDASLKGASVLTFGPIFDFMTFNFAYHDLHHLNSKIPAYNLKACYKAFEDEIPSIRLTAWEAVASIQWKLWDEDQGRMVRFKDLRQTNALMHPAE